MAADGGGQTGSVAPLLSSLATALDTATTSLSTLSPGDAGAADADLATLIENIFDVRTLIFTSHPGLCSRYFFLRT